MRGCTHVYGCAAGIFPWFFDRGAPVSYIESWLGILDPSLAAT